MSNKIHENNKKNKKNEQLSPNHMYNIYSRERCARKERRKKKRTDANEINNTIFNNQIQTVTRNQMTTTDDSVSFSLFPSYNSVCFTFNYAFGELCDTQ